MPSGEPSRRGRGGFRLSGNRQRMEAYGPPPSKSPFSTGGPDEKLNATNSTMQQPPLQNNDIHVPTNQSESTDDKIIAKQQALTAGITVRPMKSSAQQGSKNDANHMSSQRSQSRKDDSRSKRPRSGSRRVRTTFRVDK